MCWVKGDWGARCGGGGEILLWSEPSRQKSYKCVQSLGAGWGERVIMLYFGIILIFYADYAKV